MIITTVELVKRAQLAADMHDGPFTPEQWMFWGTQENIALSVFLARSGWTKNVKTTTITVTGAEAGAFTLPVSPLAIVAIHQIGSNGRVRRLRVNNAVDFLHQTVSSSAVTGDPTEYRILWDQDNDAYVANFFPQPLAGAQFLVSYIPHPLKLTLTDPSTYALATFTGKFVAQARTIGTAGNGITVTLLESAGADPVLTVDSPTQVTVRFDATGGDSHIDTTWEQVYALLNTSQYVKVLSSTASGTMSPSDAGSQVTAGGLNAADFGYALSVKYPLGFEEWIVLRMGIAAQDTEESDNSSLQKRFDRCAGYIESAVWDAVFADARVRNVDDVERGWTSKIVYPPVSEWWFA